MGSMMIGEVMKKIQIAIFFFFFNQKQKIY